jgi:hypothetical protein
MRPEEAAAVFAELRPYLHGVAYRLTSSWADAEDVIADAWPRWSECRAADVHRRHQHHQVGQAVGQDAAPAQASRLHQRPRDEHAGVVAHREHGFGVLPVPAPPPCQCGANPPRRGLFAVIEVKGDAGH